MEGLGEYLKQGRQEAGLSLEDLAGRTRIRLENLERLEDGDLASLPTDTYVRGFVRLVCKELGLPADEGIERYEMLRASRAPADEMVWSAETDAAESSRLEKALRDPERVVGIARRVGIGLAAVVVVIALVAGGRFVAGMFADRGDRPVVAAGSPAEPAEPAGAGGQGSGTDAEASGDAPSDGAGPESVDEPADDEPREPESAAPALRLALAEIEVTRGEPGIQPGTAGADLALDPLATQEDPAPTTPSESAGEPESRASAPAREEPVRLALAEVEVARGEPGIQPGSGRMDLAGETDLAGIEEDAPAIAPDEVLADAAPEPASTPPATADSRADRTPPPAAVTPEPDRTPPPAAATPEPDRTPPPPAATEPATSGSERTPPPAAAETASPRELVGRRIGSARLELEVEALRAVEFSVLLDGVGRPRTRSMKAGERRVWKAQDLFVISVDDGGAIRLWLSGEDLGIAGTDGAPVAGLRVRAR